jgi:hypothetical protein
MGKINWDDIEGGARKILDESPDELEEVKDTQDVQDLALESMLERISELNIKVVNLARQLDKHMHERDAHNPAIMRTS